MKLLWVVILLLCIASTAQATDWVNDTVIALGNGANITLMNVTLDNLTEPGADNILHMNISGYPVTYTSNVDKTITNPTWISDNFTFQTSGTAGWLNFTVGMLNASEAYDLRNSTSFIETRNTSASGIVWFNYTGDSILSVTWNTSGGGGGGVPPWIPAITAYTPLDLTPSYVVGELATFTATANQSVSWTWTGATEGAGDGTPASSATQTWGTIGAKTVTVTCSNANGSCGTIQWDVIVSASPYSGYNISGYVIYTNLSPVENARIRVLGAENVSDVNGFYTLYGLGADNYTILFEKDYYFDGVYRIVLSDNVTQNHTFVSKVHVSTPGFTGILALFGIALIFITARYRKH